MPTDGLSVATQVAQLLQEERRESSYKQAFVIALIYECTQHPEATTVSLLDLADHIIDLYWPTLNPFDGRLLDQSRQGKARIPGEVLRLKEMSLVPNNWRPGRRRSGRSYESTRLRVAQALAQMPATHLQPRSDQTSGRVDFLYDSSWLHKKVTISELNAQNWELKLAPGVAQSLARSGPLLVPLAQFLWQRDLEEYNEISTDSVKLGRHLFGSDRISLNDVRGPLANTQSWRCFYCSTPLPDNFHVDHVVPWSRCGLDDLANLVAADPACNLKKGDLLPSSAVLESATSRPKIRQIGLELDWEFAPERVLATGKALRTLSPLHSPAWDFPGVVCG